jgi:hypothetical protein
MVPPFRFWRVAPIMMGAATIGNVSVDQLSPVLTDNLPMWLWRTIART